MKAEEPMMQHSGKRARRIAWILIVVADAGLLAWGLGAALFPHRLPGPGGKPILVAGFEGFTRSSWAELTDAAPRTAAFITMIFRLFGVYIVAFGGVAIAIASTAFRRGERWAWWVLLVGNTITYGAPMTYDRVVGAIGPFELSEYLGIAVIYAALAITAPFTAAGRGVPRAPATARRARASGA